MKIHENLHRSTKIYENLVKPIIWDSMGLYGTIWDSIGLYGTTWDSMGLSGTTWDVWKSMKIYENIYENLWKPIQMPFPEPSGGKSYALNSILRVPRSNSKLLGSSCLGGNREAKSIFFISCHVARYWKIYRTSVDFLSKQYRKA